MSTPFPLQLTSASLGIFDRSLCRQVVVDDNGDAKPFAFRGNYASISFTGQDDIDLAVVRYYRFSIEIRFPIMRPIFNEKLKYFNLWKL